MKRGPIILFIVFCGFTLLSNPSFAADRWQEHLDNKWLSHAPWVGNVAEVVLYQAKEIIQRKLRLGDLQLVYEPMVLSGNNKSAMPTQLQLQMVRQFPGGLQKLTQQSQIFVSWPQLSMRSQLFSSQQWGDVITKRLDWQSSSKQTAEGIILRSGREASNAVNQRFSMEALKEAYAYEALPFLLRALDQSKGGFTFSMVDPVDSIHNEAPKAEIAELKMSPEETLYVAATAYKVRPMVLNHFLGEDHVWIAVDGDHQLIKWVRYTGAEYQFRRTESIDYWNKTQPADAALLD